MSYCPKCWSEIAIADECLCDACGWFGDPKEVLAKPGKDFNFTGAAVQVLGLFRDACRQELLMEQLYDAGVVVEHQLNRARLLRRDAIQTIIEMFVKIRTRPNIPQMILHKYPGSGMVPWPDDWNDRHFNGNDPCDMLVGPCACGAWHREEEIWVQEKLIEHQAIIVE